MILQSNSIRAKVLTFKYYARSIIGTLKGLIYSHNFSSINYFTTCYNLENELMMATKLRESTKNERQVIKTTKTTLISPKNIKITVRKLIFLFLRLGFSIF